MWQVTCLAGDPIHHTLKPIIYGAHILIGPYLYQRLQKWISVSDESRVWASWTVISVSHTCSSPRARLLAAKHWVATRLMMLEVGLSWPYCLARLSPHPRDSSYHFGFEARELF